jgi:hypothetical protein
MTRIGLDWKSLTIGLLVGVCGVVLLGANRAAPEGTWQISSWAGPSADGTLQNSVTDVHGAFLVNTRTGEVYSIFGQAGDPGRIDRARHFDSVYSVFRVKSGQE